jgi:hypothetical protein
MIATDTDLFVETDTTLYAVDLTSHKSVWSYPVSGSLTLSEGELYVAGSDGTLTAIAVPEPSTLALLGIGGLLAYVWRRRRGTA